jgi:hypothetical protein
VADVEVLAQCIDRQRRADDGVRFDTIRAIARRAREGSVITLVDGREIVLSDDPDVSHGNRGIYVDDPRYGRVLISWDAFERVDFSPGGSGPAYADFPPGRPLTGSVTTRAGTRLTGRLVYDLDESETTETLDAPSHGVDYTIPFGLIASVVPARGEVTLHDGEELQLEAFGDLGPGNAGLLIFIDGRERPEYVPWTDVERIEGVRGRKSRGGVQRARGSRARGASGDRRIRDLTPPPSPRSRTRIRVQSRTVRAIAHGSLLHASAALHVHRHEIEEGIAGGRHLAVEERRALRVPETVARVGRTE